MVMDYWHSMDATNEVAHVLRDDDQFPGASNYTPTTSLVIFDEARDAGFFRDSLRIHGCEGGMFVASQLGELAEMFGYQYEVIDDAGAEDVIRVVSDGYPALIGYDVGWEGEPVCMSGERAHWCVAIGHEEGNIIAKHGHPRTGDMCKWDATALESSMRQVQPTLSPKIVKVTPTTGGK